MASTAASWKSAAFRALVEKEGEPDKPPLLETLHGYRPMILNLIGIVILLNVADYMLLTTMPSYFTEHLKVGDTTASLIIIGVELGQMALLVPLGALSDRIGRKPLLKTAVVPIWRLPETAKVPIAKIDAEDEAALPAAGLRA